VPLPEGPPRPVERYYRAVFGGGTVPLVHSAVLSGRGTLRIAGVTLPTRYRFTHEAGRNYRHYFEATWFGLPLLKVNESYLDGSGRIEFPVGLVVKGPKTSSAANLGMWAESMAFPAVFVTDPRVRWEAIDNNSARLVVPWPEGGDGFTVEFEPATGLIRQMRTMRWRGEDDPAKLEWFAIDYGGNRGAARWADDDRPCLVFATEEIVLNADVSRDVRRRGL
jgi:hypothetical protein